MHISAAPLKPLTSIHYTADENTLLRWLKTAAWEAQTGEREPVPYKAKVPEFYSGVRLYHVKASGASQGPLELFIKKLQYQGILTKQVSHPLTTEGNARFLFLKKADLDNLGVGQDADDE